MQVFTSVLVLGLCFTAFVYSHINDYRKRKAETMSGLAQVIGTTSISSLEFDDNEEGIKILADLRKIYPEVVNAAIYTSGNKVFASYTRAGEDSFLFPPLNLGKNIVFYSAGDRYLFIYNKIISGKDIIGTVCLRVSLNELKTIKQTQLQIALILLVMGCGLAFLIAIVVQKYISKRLLNLVDVMKKVNQTNDYTLRAAIKGRDEIRELSNTFNDLMREVTESQKKKDEFIGIASHELK
ncbi:MAG: CHASE sensor domain-containing protein, partial [Ginsengibacter sp.]